MCSNAAICNASDIKLWRKQSGSSLAVKCLIGLAHELEHTLLKQTIEKSIYKDCGEGKVLIRLKIQS